ncbi:MAG: molybdopterin molybdotransferase MoeA [Rhizobiales bacterium]|nr:molybdopterin molybdotransferase MoeA [Hyphomicrobiales bacterium]
MSLLPVHDAKARILKGVKPLPGEWVGLAQALGRVLSRPVRAKRDQPAFACSAMDGYAVRAADIASVPVDLEVIGESKAGGAFPGKVGPGQAVNIYTGAPLPRGADAIVIQEDTKSDAGAVTVLETTKPGRFVRPRGFDFQRGQTLIEPPRQLTARDIGVAASANCARIAVRNRPVVAIIGTGDELVLPGETPRSDQIVSSNNAALAGFIRHFGGEPMDLGIVPDRLGALKRAIAKARKADVMVTIGGASVGKHDLVQQALTESGIKMNFWRIAMRPGKPLMFAKRGRQRIIGLPGNPVSALVCARIFLKPLIDALLGLAPEEPIIKARLGAPLAANDQRQDYLRARLVRDAGGHLTVTSFTRQDSSMQAILANSDALIIRQPFAKAARKGAAVDVLPIDF